jgi:L-ascorbate metabolism protein UlaG (beta-lactamase superfamily)
MAMQTQLSMPLDVTYVGGPTVTLSIAGLRFMTDPTFDPAGREYPRGAYSLRKTRGPALEKDEIGRIDVVLLSHDQHPDNLDEAGRELLSRASIVLTTPAAADRLGPPAKGLAPWATHLVDGPHGVRLRITATPARHGPVGVERIAGEVAGFVVSDVGTREDLAYVTGDTVWFEGTQEVARRFDPRVILLFAGAATVPRGAFHLTMNVNDALEAAAAFPRSIIVPVHHDGWAHFTQSQADLEKAFSLFGRADQLRSVVPGKALTL